MPQGSYGKEPFDLRLTVLRLLRQFHIIAAVTVLGVVLFGGGYYVKNVWMRDEVLYQSTSIYRVEFNVESEAEVTTTHINQTSWNTYMQTKAFLDAVQSHLADNNRLSDGTAIGLSNEELGATIKAFLASDLRVPSTTITTDLPEKSILIAQAVEKAMVGEFAESLREVVRIQVIDPAMVAEEVVPDVRTGRAVILSAVLSFFFVVLVLLIKETWDDSIYLPASVWKRYGIKCVGGLTLCQQGARARGAAATEQEIFATREFAQNMRYLYADKANVAVCPVAEDINPDGILKALKDLCPDVVGENWFATPAPLLCPEICEQLRAVDGILLVVNSGAHVGKNFERVLEFMEQQECKITSVMLCDADEMLLKWYYLGVRNTEKCGE